MDLYYFNVVVNSICPNGCDDVRSYNEVELVRLNSILRNLKPDDRVTITYLFGSRSQDEGF